MSNKPQKILDAAIATGAGGNFTITDNTSFQAFLTGTTGALSATCEIEVSNDGVHFVNAATITLSVAAWSTSADDDTDGFFASEIRSWAYVRARVSAISGTGAAVSAFMGK